MERRRRKRWIVVLKWDVEERAPVKDWREKVKCGKQWKQVEQNWNAIFHTVISSLFTVLAVSFSTLFINDI